MAENTVQALSIYDRFYPCISRTAGTLFLPVLYLFCPVQFTLVLFPPYEELLHKLLMPLVLPLVAATTVL